MKRLTLLSDYEKGGLRMPHIESLVKTQSIMSMKKYLDSSSGTWKSLLDNYLSDFGGSFLLKCNYNVKFPLKMFPTFYKECLAEWALYKHIRDPNLSSIPNEIIWNNRFICVGGKPSLRKNLLPKVLSDCETY